MSIDIVFETPSGLLKTTIRRVLCAGYTGRTRSVVEAHIDELKAFGIGRPPHIPMLFPIIPALLSQSTTIDVIGPDTAPEVEYVVFRHEGRDFVTVGSDQTDSIMEGKAACQSKNLCAKSVARQAWPLDEISKHWDSLELSLTCGGTSMQHGSVASMMTPDQIREFVAEHDGPEHEGRMIFSGTLETHGRFPRGVQNLTIDLHDPVLKRRISHLYQVTPISEIFPPANA